MVGVSRISDELQGLDLLYLKTGVQKELCINTNMRKLRKTKVEFAVTELYLSLSRIGILTVHNKPYIGRLLSQYQSPLSLNFVATQTTAAFQYDA